MESGNVFADFHGATKPIDVEIGGVDFYNDSVGANELKGSRTEDTFELGNAKGGLSAEDTEGFHDCKYSA